MIILLSGSSCYAGVYSCKRPDGSIEFRDKPCDMGSDEQTFVSIPYHKTDAKSLKAQDKKFEKTLKQHQKENRKTIRTQQQEKRIQEKKITQSKRREGLCERTREHITFLESQIRTPHKVKRHLRLEQQLSEAKLKEKRYCNVD